MGKISVTLKHNDERARERFEVLSTSAVEIKDILKERDKECREYRGRREELRAGVRHRKTEVAAVIVQPADIVDYSVYSLSSCRDEEHGRGRDR